MNTMFLSLDSQIYTGCCAILDSIVSYIFKQLQLKGERAFSYFLRIFFTDFFYSFIISKQEKDSLRNFWKYTVPWCEYWFFFSNYSQIVINWFLWFQVVQQNSEIFHNMMSTLLNLVMSEDCRNQWSMSRPLLVLILLYEDYFRWILFLNLFLIGII